MRLYAVCLFCDYIEKVVSACLRWYVQQYLPDGTVVSTTQGFGWPILSGKQFQCVPA